MRPTRINITEAIFSPVVHRMQYVVAGEAIIRRRTLLIYHSLSEIYYITVVVCEHLITDSIYRFGERKADSTYPTRGGRI